MGILKSVRFKPLCFRKHVLSKIGAALLWHHYTDSDGDSLMADMYCARLAAMRESIELKFANGVEVYPGTFRILQGSLKYRIYNCKACQRNRDKKSILDLHCNICYNEERTCLKSTNFHTKKITVL